MELNINDIKVLITTFFDVSIFYIAFFNLFDKRKIDWKIKLLSVSILFLTTWIVILNVEYLVIKYILLIIILSIMMGVLFKCKKIFAILVVISIYFLFTFMDYFLLYIVHLEYETYNAIVNEFSGLFILIIIDRMICLIIVIYLTKNKKNKISLDNEQMIKFVILSLFTVVALISEIIPYEMGAVPKKLIVTFILIFNNIFVYYILYDLIKVTDKLRMTSINKERVANELNLWKKIREKDKVQRKLMHDYNNNLIIINGLLEDNKIDELKEFISGISVEYKLSKSYVRTANPLLDVLINNKYEKALENDITMVLKLDKLDFLDIKNEDLIILLSNLIDNAIEHCLTLEMKNKKIFISIKKGDKLQIIIRNPIEKYINVDDNIVKTTKKSSNHGIGMTNIKEIIKRYNGYGSIMVDDGNFTYLIEI